MPYVIKFMYDHVEVYDDKGRFLFSADNQSEALHDLPPADAA